MKSYPKIFPFASIIALSILALTLTKCTTKHDEQRILFHKGNEVLFNYSTFTEFIYGGSDSLYATLPAQNGDLLLLNESFLFLDESYPDTLETQANDSCLWINNTIAHLKVNRKYESFINGLSDEALRNLKGISIEDSLEYIKPILTRISKLTPHVTLSFYPLSDEEMNWILGQYSPNALITGIYGEVHWGTIGLSQNLSTLMLLIDSVSTPKTLPHIKPLKNLIIFPEKDVIDSTLLSNNLQLERLTVLDNEGVKPYWKGLHNLKFLSIIGENHEPYTIAHAHPKLTKLNLFNSSGFSLEGLTNLKWLSVTGDHSFSIREIVRGKNDLEFLQITNTDSLERFDDLKNLPALKYLVINETLDNDSALFNLKQLKYLSVPQSYFEDSIRLGQLKAVLPNTIIVTNEGLCMGSGWLLLILPLTWLFILINRKKMKAV